MKYGHPNIAQILDHMSQIAKESGEFEIAVCAFPSLYPYSAVKKSLRRAVLSNVLSVYYRIHKGKIEVIAILDNRCDAEKWI